jgi:site-specific recombinase XerD
MEVQTQWTIRGLVESFDEYLRQVRGAQDETCRGYTRYAEQFLVAVFADERVDPHAIEPPDVVRFIEARSRRWLPGSVKMIATALRAFFRFLRVAGVGDARLADAVPTVARWRLSTLPRFLDGEQLARLHAALDPSTRQGRRDRAIVLCLSGLGLRAAEVAGLHLEDIDWRASVLRVRTRKTRRGDLLPIPRDVGRAIVAYLRDGRPAIHDRYVFVVERSGAPLRARAVRDVVRATLRRAGITGLATTGSHVLRHTLATRMIRGGASLKEIADVLGHRCLDTTTIYAKVDLSSLADVGLPWPEVTP